TPTPPTISGDGRFIALTAHATAEIAGITTMQPGVDALVFDANSPGTMTLASHPVGSSTTTGNDFSQSAVISRDGSTVAFLSDATNLLPSGKLDTNNGTDLFVFYNQAVGSIVAGTTLTGTLRDPGLPSLTANGYSVALPLGTVSDDG